MFALILVVVIYNLYLFFAAIIFIRKIKVSDDDQRAIALTKKLFPTIAYIVSMFIIGIAYITNVSIEILLFALIIQSLIVSVGDKKYFLFLGDIKDNKP